MASNRKVLRVENYKNTEGKPRCKVTIENLGREIIVGLRDLSRPEMMSAARVKYPTLPGNAWFRLSTALITEAIQADSEAEAHRIIVANGADKAQRKGGPEQPTPDAPLVPETPVIETPSRVSTDAQRSKPDVAQQIADLLAQATSSVDLDEVREMVATEVKRQVVELGVTRIEIATQDGTRELPVSHHSILPKVLALVALRLNIFLVGPCGTGKSTIAHQAAEALGLRFFSLSVGPTTPTSKFFGYMDANGNYVRTPFREAYEGGGVILVDELDNGHPGLVAELNQATANGTCAFADGMVTKHKDCVIMATGNTYGTGPDRLFVGRNILDAATLDRFWTLEVPVDEKLEARLARAYASDENRPAIEDWIGYVQQVRRKVESLKLPVVVSPRSTIEGAMALSVGISLADVKAHRLFKGMGADVISKIA